MISMVSFSDSIRLQFDVTLVKFRCDGTQEELAADTVRD